MGWPARNCAGTLSSLESRKKHLQSICLQNQLYLLLNSHLFCLLKNEMGLIIFFLCAYIPKTAAGHCKWAEVLKDLEQIKTSKKRGSGLGSQLLQRKYCGTLDIDVSLYTANTDEGLNSTTSAKCKECEEYEEKNFTEFIQSFVKVIQKECKH
ncbi:interleukin-15 isoform X5 [Opisthocomus hoazin]|uniref:interleukin-15 isoform X5 n=1 Tax=Opisthocomus hoazin TaxID=30419 RepID=UPI003F538CB4